MTGSFSIKAGFLLSQTTCWRVEQNFSFFPTVRPSRGRIFNSKYLYCEDVRQVFQIVLMPSGFANRNATLRNYNVVPQPRPIVDCCFQLISGTNRADAGGRSA